MGAAAKNRRVFIDFRKLRNTFLKKITALKELTAKLTSSGGNIRHSAQASYLAGYLLI